MSERQNDPFAFEDEDDNEKQLADIVKERNRLGKKLREAQARITELEPFEASAQKAERESKLTGVFMASGVNPKHVRIFSALNPDVDPATVTVEKVRAFAAENELPVQESEKTDENAQNEQKEGFSPVPTPPSGPASGVMDMKAFLELAGKDAMAAQAAFLAGKVDTTEVHQGLGPR